jgi:hypothetical protein
MHPRYKSLTSATALFLALGICLTYSPLSLAQSNANASPQVSAILTTVNNQPIIVNGANAITGATIKSGASIQTPAQVGASLILPGHFSLDIAANANVTIDFDVKGIKVNLIKGCVVLHVIKGTSAEISTSKGVVAKADGSKDERLDVCDPSVATAPAAAAEGGLGAGGVLAIIAAIGGAVALIPILTGGGNPSPGAP